jgi:hypothetical protein
MIKATLRYTNCLQDGRNVFAVLAGYNIPILKSSRGDSMYPKIVALFNDQTELSTVLGSLQKHCSYEVRLVKSKFVKE